MKVCIVVLVALCLAASAVTALPRNVGDSNPNNDAEIVVVPLEHQHPSGVPQAGGEDGFGDFDDDDIITIGVVQPSFFSRIPAVINPFNWNFGLTNRFEDIFRNIFTQSQLPVDTDEDDWAKDGEGNTTSTVKIVDGHKVMINETVYTKQSRFGVSVYKVRTVNVLPLDDDSVTVAIPDLEQLPPIESTKEPAAASDGKPAVESEADDLERGSPEVLDNAHRRNEISKDIDNVETFEVDANDDDVNDVNTAGHQRQQHQKHQQQFESLIHDENQFANMNRPNTHHHELQSSDEHQKLESFDEEEYHHDNINADHNELDDFQQLPVDLSNDIAVNEMQADQGAAFNPDADVFDVNEVVKAHLNELLRQQQYEHQKNDNEWVNYQQEIKK